MKKFGFTLAEVLITMGIIGVVAAMTAPFLATNIQRQSHASMLKTTVGDLENAFSAAMANEKVENLAETSIFTSGVVSSNNNDKEDVIDSFKQYLKLADDNDIGIDAQNYHVQKGAQAPRPMGAKGSPAAGNISIEGNALSLPLKSGAVMFIRRLDGEGHTVANVYIDVNGAEGPNVMGRDIFRFFLQDDGTLAPYGSKRANNNGGGGLWTTSCPRNGDITDGETCTARLVENNYVFDY